MYANQVILIIVDNIVPSEDREEMHLPRHQATQINIPSPSSSHS